MQDFTRQRLQWDDLHLVLAVSRAGSFASAAATLGVSTPTIFRRAKALEERLGTLVFRRDNTGVKMTAAGREVATIARQIEEEIVALETRVGNEDLDAAGTVRLASVDTLIAGPLMPIIAAFRRDHPSILLDLRSGAGMADLRQREVDAALRAGGEPPESLIGRKLCRIAVAVYRRAESAADTKDLDRVPWIVPNDELGHLASARWLKERGHYASAALQVNSLHTLSLAIANGIGQGILPCYLADTNPRLLRVGDPVADLSSDLWFLTHSELRHTARVRALSDHLAQQIQVLRPLFHGVL